MVDQERANFESLCASGSSFRRALYACRIRIMPAGSKHLNTLANFVEYTSGCLRNAGFDLARCSVVEVELSELKRVKARTSCIAASWFEGQCRRGYRGREAGGGIFDHGQEPESGSSSLANGVHFCALQSGRHTSWSSAHRYRRGQCECPRCWQLLARGASWRQMSRLVNSSTRPCELLRRLFPRP